MSVPKFGSLTNPSIDILEEIRTIQKLGFDYVEIGIEEPNATPQILMEQKEKISKLLKKSKAPPVGHTAYWVHFGSSHEKVRRGWIEEAKEMIHTASVLKIKFLNFHFYGGYGLTGILSGARNKFVKNFIKSMKELTSFAKKKGVTLMLENMPAQPGRDYGIKEYAQVIRSVPNLMVHLDIAHSFTEGGMNKVEDYVRIFKKKIVHIHWHDNHGEEDEHLPVGEGLIDHERIIRILKKINYSRTVTLEVFPRKENAKKSMIKLKKLWEKL